MSEVKCKRIFEVAINSWLLGVEMNFCVKKMGRDEVGLVLLEM